MFKVYIITVKIFGIKYEVFIDKNEKRSYVTNTFVLENWTKSKDYIVIEENGIATIEGIPLSCRKTKIYSSFDIRKDDISMIVLGRDWLKSVNAYHFKRKGILIVQQNGKEIHIPAISYREWQKKFEVKPKKEIFIPSLILTETSETEDILEENISESDISTFSVINEENVEMENTDKLFEEIFQLYEEIMEDEVEVMPTLYNYTHEFSETFSQKSFENQQEDFIPTPLPIHRVENNKEDEDIFYDALEYVEETEEECSSLSGTSLNFEENNSEFSDYDEILISSEEELSSTAATEIMEESDKEMITYNQHEYTLWKESFFHEFFNSRKVHYQWKSRKEKKNLFYKSPRRYCATNLENLKF